MVFTLKPSAAAWARGAVIFTPPPPPASRKQPEAPAPPRRFDDAVFQPKAIPDSSALRSSSASPAIAPQLTDPGNPSDWKGLDNGVLGGVLFPDVTPSPPKRIRVGGRIQSGRALHKVAPVYPVEAIEQGISGIVRLEAVIAADGSIKQLRTIKGDPLLAQAAREAISQWRYRPTKLNGRAVEVLTSIEINFKLTVELDEEGRPIKKMRDGSR